MSFVSTANDSASFHCLWPTRICFSCLFRELLRFKFPSAYSATLATVTLRSNPIWADFTAGLKNYIKKPTKEIYKQACAASVRTRWLTERDIGCSLWGDRQRGWAMGARPDPGQYFEPQNKLWPYRRRSRRQRAGQVTRMTLTAGRPANLTSHRGSPTAGERKK